MSTTATPDNDIDCQDKPTDFEPLKPHAVVVLNDDEHSFEYVVDTFLKVFKYPVEKCAKLALKIHENGRWVVWSGSKEVAELKAEQIKSAGPDMWAAKKVTWPLGVLVEEMP